MPHTSNSLLSPTKSMVPRGNQWQPRTNSDGSLKFKNYQWPTIVITANQSASSSGNALGNALGIALGNSLGNVSRNGLGNGSENGLGCFRKCRGTVMPHDNNIAWFIWFLNNRKYILILKLR